MYMPINSLGYSCIKKLQRDNLWHAYNEPINIYSEVLFFWEAHKNLRNSPHTLDIYFVNVQTIRKIFSNFVCSSERPNFKRK